MFDFFKKRQQEKEAAFARSQTFKEVIDQVGSGKGSLLEAALMLHLTENNKDSQSRFLVEFGSSDLWILNSESGRFGDPAVTEGNDGAPYIAAFTSPTRAALAANEWELPNKPALISSLELVFALNSAVGIVLNAHEPHFLWNFTPQQVSNLRLLFEDSHVYQQGGIYSIWNRNAYGAAKLLRADEKGLHLRIYGNTWHERPAAVNVNELTLQSPGDDHFSIGHIPLIKSGFLSMGPRFLTHAPVTDEELEGYKIWEEAKGGYFGS